jgi:catechol 2,3-dioxygenase-like lactoylglutathione lyase family enzyme
VPQIKGIAPEFVVADVTKAAEHYRDRLGFRIVGYFFEDPPVFAMVGRDDHIVMLSLAEGSRGGSNRSHKGGSIDAYLWVDDVEALYAEFHQSGADIAMPPIYGMKEIEVRDLDGYILCFGQDVPSGPASV